jgi:hypothetical protein
MRCTAVLLALSALIATARAGDAAHAPAPSASPRPHHARAEAPLQSGCTFSCPPVALAARYELQRERVVRSGVLCAYADGGARAPDRAAALTCAFAPVRARACVSDRGVMLTARQTGALLAAQDRSCPERARRTCSHNRDPAGPYSVYKQRVRQRREDGAARPELPRAMRERAFLGRQKAEARRR